MRADGDVPGKTFLPIRGDFYIRDKGIQRAAALNPHVNRGLARQVQQTCGNAFFLFFQVQQQLKHVIRARQIGLDLKLPLLAIRAFGHKIDSAHIVCQTRFGLDAKLYFLTQQRCAQIDLLNRKIGNRDGDRQVRQAERYRLGLWQGYCFLRLGQARDIKLFGGQFVHLQPSAQQRSTGPDQRHIRQGQPDPVSVRYGHLFECRGRTQRALKAINTDRAARPGQRILNGAGQEILVAFLCCCGAQAQTPQQGDGEHMLECADQNDCPMPM